MDLASACLFVTLNVSYHFDRNGQNEVHKGIGIECDNIGLVKYTSSLWTDATLLYYLPNDYLLVGYAHGYPDPLPVVGLYRDFRFNDHFSMRSLLFPPVVALGFTLNF